MSKTGHTAVNPEGFSEGVHTEERAEVSSSDATAPELSRGPRFDPVTWARQTLESLPVGWLYQSRVEHAEDIMRAYDAGVLAGRLNPLPDSPQGQDPAPEPTPGMNP